MKIYVELRKVWPTDRSVEGRFFTDDFPEGTDFMNLTIYADPIPQGQALIDYLVRSYAPRDWLKLKGDAKKSLPDMSSVEALCSTTEQPRVHFCETALLPEVTNDGTMRITAVVETLPIESL